MFFNIFFIRKSDKSYPLAHSKLCDHRISDLIGLPEIICSSCGNLIQLILKALMLTLPLKNSSAHLPPRTEQIRSNNSSLLSNVLSLGRYCANPRDPLERGIIVSYNFQIKTKFNTFNRGCPPGKNQLTTACPDS